MDNKNGKKFKVDWYRTKVPAKQIQELNKRSDFKGFIQSIGYLSLPVSSGCASYYVYLNFHWAWLLPVLLLHGIFCSFGINAVHELVHNSVFKTKWLNSFFASIFAFFGWINHKHFWASHAEHHKFTLHPPHDQEVVLPIRYTFWGVFSSLFINYKGLYNNLNEAFRLSRGKLEDGWEKHLFENQERRFAMFNWSRILLIGHTVILGVSIYNGWWLLPILTSCTSCYGHVLHFFLNNSQHTGLQDRVNDFRVNCRTITVNPFFEFLYWKMNYHIEHHMYAAVPCYNLKKLHKIIKDDLPPTSKGLISTWYEILSIQFQQERDSSYKWEPKIPAKKNKPIKEKVVISTKENEPVKK